METLLLTEFYEQAKFSFKEGGNSMNQQNNENATNSGIDSDSKENWVYLTTAENEFEYNVIKGKLTDSNIICVGKGRDMDLLDSGFLNVFLGPCIAVEIMVPRELYDEAKQILDMKISDEELEELAINPQQSENDEK